MSEEIKEKIKAYYIANDIDEILNYITSLQQKVEQLEKENKILKENAEHNDKVVDKVNWKNMLLNNIINGLEKYLIEMSDRSWDDNGAYDDVLDKLRKLKEE